MPRTHHTEQESDDSSPPMEIKRSTKIAAPISLIIAFTGAIAVTYATWDTQKNSIISLDSRVTKLEQSQTEMASNVEKTLNNVEWMRRIMEGKYGVATPPSSNPNGH